MRCYFGLLVVASVLALRCTGAPTKKTVSYFETREGQAYASLRRAFASNSHEAAIRQKSSEMNSLVGPFSQCGGDEYEGPTECIPNWTCSVRNPLYSQCLPTVLLVSTSPPPPTINPPNSPITSDESTTSPPDTDSPGPSPSSSPTDGPSTPQAPTTDLPSVSSVPLPTNQSEAPTAPTTEPPQSTATPTNEPVSTASPTSAQTTLVAAWEQCAGQGLNYTKYGEHLDGLSGTRQLACVAGYDCFEINAQYFQCVPHHDALTAALWDQCGGEGFEGITACVAGSVCQYDNPWYSQCVPTTSK